jgi:hypothetical protein
MINELKSELLRILETLEIESPLTFKFGGRRVSVDGSTLHQLPHAPSIKNPLVAALQIQFYQHCYCRRFTGTISEPPKDGGKDLTADLMKANAGRERWEPGWRIVQALSSGQLAVQRNGLNRLLWPGEYLSPDGPGGMPQPGNYVNVYCKKDSTSVQPGFYFAFGETLSDQQDQAGPVRFYWSVKTAGILDLMRGVTGELNRFQIPFHFKCPTRAALYERSDAAVLYVAKRLYRIVGELLGGTYQSVAHNIRAETPLFAKHLAPGLGLAEDPANGESFGSHRCRLMAEAMCDANTQDRQTVEERLEAVEKQFRQNGLTLESPHLSRGSINSYDWPVGQVSLL